MSNTHSGQLIVPISFFENVEDSGQIKSFTQRGEFIRVPNPLYVTPEQEGQDFAENANFMFNQPITWAEFVDFMMGFALDEHENKEDACLFAPTVFQTRLYWNGNGGPYAGFRCKQNATTAAVVAIDADNKSNPQTSSG
jgi:hypothetical protein